MAHTSGPFRVEVDEAVRVKDSEGGTVCTMSHVRGRFGSLGRRDGDEVVATAYLFAAAPDMLEALEAVEWNGYRAFSCPLCQRYKTEGHADDCLIGIALREARGEEVG